MNFSSTELSLRIQYETDPVATFTRHTNCPPPLAIMNDDPRPCDVAGENEATTIAIAKTIELIRIVFCQFNVFMIYALSFCVDVPPIKLPNLDSNLSN